MKKLLRSGHAVEWLCVGALMSVAGWAYLACASVESRGLLTFAVLNVGQGDALYIESPSGVRVLLDGGIDNSVLNELSKVMPFSARKFDAVIESHPDADHIAGLVEVIARYNVGALIEPGIPKTSATAQALERAVAQQNIPRYIARRGMVIDIGGGATLQILYPDNVALGSARKNDNKGVVVARLVYGNFSALLTADAPFDVENRLMQMERADGVSELESDILKVGHHGSKTSTSVAFLSGVHPSLAIISVGAKNKYGHPTQETLEILSTANVPVLRTDKDGAVIIQSNGEEFWRAR